MEEEGKIRGLIEGHAYENNIDPIVLLALVTTESSFNQYAIRYEPKYIWIYNAKELAMELKCSIESMRMMQMTSWGICQIMGGSAYETGFKGWCTELCDPNINLKWSCKYLKKLITRQSLTDPLDIYAAWNYGHVHKTNGIYSNNQAVLRFKRNLTMIKRFENK